MTYRSKVHNLEPVLSCTDPDPAPLVNVADLGLAPLASVADADPDLLGSETYYLTRSGSETK